MPLCILKACTSLGGKGFQWGVFLCNFAVLIFHDEGGQKLFLGMGTKPPFCH